MIERYQTWQWSDAQSRASPQMTVNITNVIFTVEKLILLWAWLATGKNLRNQFNPATESKKVPK
jgi:hypothetical protein